MPFKMGLIPKEVPKDKRWTVVVDNMELDDISTIELRAKFGVLTYGQRPEGYPSWVFAQQGGGGVITLPYVIPVEGELLVGLIKEKRANMGEEPVWCVVGGFIKPSETHREAQARELAEEAGFLEVLQSKEMPGLPINANRAFFVADPLKGEGDHAYCLRVSEGDLEADGDSFKLKDALLFPDFKKVNDLRFFPWRKAVLMTADGLALAALARLKVTIG